MISHMALLGFVAQYVSGLTSSENDVARGPGMISASCYYGSLSLGIKKLHLKTLSLFLCTSDEDVPYY